MNTAQGHVLPLNMVKHMQQEERNPPLRCLADTRDGRLRDRNGEDLMVGLSIFSVFYQAEGFDGENVAGSAARIGYYEAVKAVSIAADCVENEAIVKGVWLGNWGGFLKCESAIVEYVLAACSSRTLDEHVRWMGHI